MKCSEDAALHKRFVDKERIYDFLAGLNLEFDAIRVQILGKEDLPSLNEVISLIRAKEGRRGVMLETPSGEGSALVSLKANNPGRGPKEEKKSVDKDSLWCTFCKKPRHTIAKCWKLHGKPPKGGPVRSSMQGQGYMANSQSPEPRDSEQREVQELKKSEIDRLRSFLGSLDKKTDKGTCSLANTGNTSYSYSEQVSKIMHQNSWVLDSGASDHMTHFPRLFISYYPCLSSRKITMANGSLTTVAGQEDIFLNKNLILKNVLLVPKLFTNLISIQKLIEDTNCHALFHSNICEIQEQGKKKMIGLVRAREGLYYLEEPDGQDKQRFFSRVSCLVQSNLHQFWLHHYRLAHPYFHTLKLMFPDLGRNLEIKNFHCAVCEFAKHKRVSFPLSNKKSDSPFSLIHSDIWGPSNIPNISGARWFVIFVDNCIRVVWLYLLKTKSEVSQIFPTFNNMIQNQFGVEIKRFRFDNAKDFFNQSLSLFFQKKCIIHESSCPYTPQQNGVAERKNGHLLTVVRALLFHHRVPKYYWGEAALTTATLINRLPSKNLASRSLIQLLIDYFPDFHTTSHWQPKIFGCTAYVRISAVNRGKLDPRALKCVLTGNSPTQKGYRCYHPPTRKFFVSADVTFAENEPLKILLLKNRISICPLRSILSFSQTRTCYYLFNHLLTCRNL